MGSITGLERSLGEGNGNLLSILAWRIPLTEELGGLQSIGLQRVGHNWSDFIHTHTYIIRYCETLVLIGFFLLINRSWVQGSRKNIPGYIICCKIQIACFTRWCKNWARQRPLPSLKGQNRWACCRVLWLVCLLVHSSAFPPGVSVPFSVINLQRLSFMTGS